MPEEKSIFASRSVWGAVVAIAATGLGLAGFPIPGEHRGDIADLLTQGAGLAGAAVALWGRISAKSRLRL
jgi:hypothetical protein